jgi:hypothetical protein
MKALLPLWMEDAKAEEVDDSLEQQDNGEGEDDVDGILALILFEFLKEEEQETFWQKLEAEGRRRRDRKIPRVALLSPKQSPWQKLFSSGNDQALITVTGFDHAAFKVMLDMYTPYFEKFTPWTGEQDGTTYRPLQKKSPKNKGGRKRIIMPHASLGLVLAWYRFRGAEFVLQGWFGFTGSHANVWLRFGRRMLLKALLKSDNARPAWPDATQIKELQAIIQQHHTSLRDVFCVMDGLKLQFEQCAGLEEQGMYYNGWTHGHYITNLLVFGIDGRIIKTVLNVPGSIHDSTLCHWGGVYKELSDIYDATGAKCCVDSAFKSNPNPYLIKSSQDVTRCQNPEEVLQSLQATSLRQPAEWGMRAIQGAFPRLKDKIKFKADAAERKVMLKLVVLLYNFRVEHVGLNQIRNTYVPNWSKDATYTASLFAD